MRYFITNVLPHHLSGKYNISYAASNFSWALINSTVFNKVFSIAPMNVSGDLEDVQMKELIYSSWRKKGFLLRKLAPIKENILIFKRIECGSNIWFYNISILNIALFLLCKLFKPSVRCNVIILDIYIPKRKLSLDYLCLWAINHADATVKLADSPRFTCVNTACLPGVVPFNAPSFPTINKVKAKFLLSGLLREDISQISLVIKVFSKVKGAQLYITGFSEKDEELRNKCSQYTNIHYLGELPFNEYIKLLHETSFLLSTRNPLEEGNQCNFPSKVIEGILHNRIIVSTIEYKQLTGLKYFCVSSNENIMRKQIEDMLNMEQNIIIQYANQSDYAKKMFNPNKWNEIMTSLEKSNIDVKTGNDI